MKNSCNIRGIICTIIVLYIIMVQKLSFKAIMIITVIKIYSFTLCIGIYSYATKLLTFISELVLYVISPIFDRQL